MLSHNVRTHKSVTPSNSIKEQCLAQALSLLIAIICFLCLPRTAISAVECQFVLGFATLRDLIGHEIVGECLENERHGANGDALQQTTGGLLVWRKADNWTAFTDGYRTWINGPDGLVQRLNTERFEWEADYAPGDGIAAPTPTPTPTPIPTPTGSPASDRAALVAFYNATDGPNWDNSSNWLSNEPLSEWFGVSTDASGRVTALNLGSQWNDKRELLYRGNNLSGSIPPAIGNLSNLDQLILSDNNLSGSIPPEIGTLTNLNTLNLSGNALTGSIPPAIGNLSNLDWLILSDNNLSGSIPPEIGTLTNLNGLFLFDNTLSGSIPPEIGTLTNLNTLNLSGNALTGSIPPEIGTLTNLNGLVLFDNTLSGSIPPEIGTLTNLNTLNLSGNALTGSIPPEIGNLSNLDWLSLADNNLSGSIPPVIGNLSNLDWLSLADNNLSGSIPPVIGNLSNLDWLSLADNNLSGSIPPVIGKLTNLNTLNLRGNALTGSIPPEIGTLTNLNVLNLSGNALTGSIPPEIGNLSNLDWLSLADNNLSGSIPPVIGNLSNLDWLNLADNNLTGPIPPEIGNLSNLDWLHLSDNNLTGPIPPEIGKLTNLNGLFLRYNALTGSIPPEIGNLSNLDWLSLADNTLSGPIPPEIGNLSNLNWLTLDNGHCGPPKLRTWLRELRERRLDVLPCIDPRARLLPRALLREDSDGLSLALDADLHDPQEVSVSDSAVVAAEIQNGWLALSPRGRGEAEVTIVPLNGGPPATAKVVVRAAVGTFGIDIVIEQPASDLYADTLTAAADRWSAVLDGTEWEGRDARKNCERWARDVPVAGGGNELTVWALRETAPDSLSMTTGWAWSCRRNEGPETEPSRYYPIAGTVVVNEVYRNAPGNVRLMLHEIGHILGLAGAFPPATGLVTEDRRYFIGPQAVAAFRKGGGDPDLPGIPLASDRVHWGSGVRDELMASAGSSDGLSVAALADAGYTVDFSKVIPCDTSNNCLIK